MAIQYLWERAEESMAHLMGRFQSGGSGCSAAKALTGIEPNRQTQPKFERNQTYHRKDLFGISEMKKHLHFGRGDKGKSGHGPGQSIGLGGPKSRFETWVSLLRNRSC
jgi:hypothetical protein